MLPHAWFVLEGCCSIHVSYGRGLYATNLTRLGCCSIPWCRRRCRNEGGERREAGLMTRREIGVKDAQAVQDDLVIRS